MDEYINVNLIDIKDSMVREFVTVNEDGGHSVFVNARLSQEGRLTAYRHALRHIENGDFEKDDVQQIEAEAHK